MPSFKKPVSESVKELPLDYYLKSGWQVILNKYNQLAAQYGITQAMGYVLINIHKEGTPVTQIASLMGVKSTSLSRILNHLEKLGLIYRMVNDEDKRSVKVFLTPTGIEKKRIARNVVLDLNAYLDQHMSKSEKTVVINVLNRINSIIPDYNPENQ